MSERIVGRSILAIILSTLIGLYCYGSMHYRVWSGERDQQVCGVIESTSSHQEVVGGKSKYVEDVIVGRVDFGQYGDWVMRLDAIDGYGGVGAQYCVNRSVVDQSLKMPNGWAFYLIFFSAALLTVCTIWLMFVIVVSCSWAFGDNK